MYTTPGIPGVYEEHPRDPRGVWRTPLAAMPAYDKGSGAHSPSHRFFIVFSPPGPPWDPRDPQGAQGMFRNIKKIFVFVGGGSPGSPGMKNNDS